MAPSLIDVNHLVVVPSSLRRNDFAVTVVTKCRLRSRDLVCSASRASSARNGSPSKAHARRRDSNGGTITHHHAVRDHRRWYDRQRPLFARRCAPRREHSIRRACSIRAFSLTQTVKPASPTVNDPLNAQFEGAQRSVRVSPEHIFPNCPRFIPD
jgi:hypothetical protein